MSTETRRGRRVAPARLALAGVLLLAGRPAAAAGETEAWTFSANLRASLTDNVFLLPEPSDEEVAGATLSLGYSRISPRASFAASGWTNGQLFRRFNSYDTAAYGLGAAATRRFSHLVSGQFSASYANGVNLESFYSSAVGVPQVDIQSGTASAGLDLRLSPDTSVRPSLDATAVRYRTDRLVSSAQLPSDALTPPEVLAPLRPRPEPELPQAPDASQVAVAALSSEALQTSSLDYRTWHAVLALAHQLSPRTQANVDLGYRRTYQQPTTYAEGDQLEARAAMRQVLSRSANLTLAYTYQNNRFGPGYETQTLTGGIDTRPSEHVKLDFSLGATHVASPGSASEWDLVGGAGLAARLQRTQLALRYTRTRYQALVLGRNQLSDLVFGSLAHAFSKRVSGSAWGYYSRSRDPVDDLYSFDAAAAGGSLGVRIGKRTSGGLSYGFQRFDSRDFPHVSRQIASVFLSYAWIGK